MNLKLVSRLVGRVLLVEAFFMLLPLAVALLYQEDPAPFLLTILLMAILGLALSAVPATRHLGAHGWPRHIPAAPPGLAAMPPAGSPFPAKLR